MGLSSHVSRQERVTQPRSTRSVTLGTAWATDANSPADEDGTRQATELVPGAPIETPYETAKRQIGGFRAAVTIRYDKM
jgi:hypothetical protein